jgi:hypothetical protein
MDQPVACLLAALKQKAANGKQYGSGRDFRRIKDGKIIPIISNSVWQKRRFSWMMQ